MAEQLRADPSYNHENPTKFSAAECADVVGRRATLTFEGTVTSYSEAESGAFVLFTPDERFGFGGRAIGLDLDLLTVEADRG